MRTQISIVRIIALMSLAVLSAYSLQALGANTYGVELGVIRWDAWVGPPNSVGIEVEATMSPLQYHNRLPFYGVEVSPSSVQVRATTQAVIDQEIAYARRAGVNFWAFYRYTSATTGLHIARELYKSSRAKDDLKFALIIDPHHTPVSHFNDVVSDLSKPYYQRVIGNRPLLFIWGADGLYSRTQIDSLRSLAMNSGLANPFIVVLDWEHDRAGTTATALGAQATSSYASGGSNGIPFSSLMSFEQQSWSQRWSASGHKVIPWVTTGWDPRPRITTPVSWASYASNNWVQPATPVQIAAQLQAALNWRASNSHRTEAPIVLMYAWNEFDEGGWICPTHSEGTSKIDAISEVMRYSASSARNSAETARKAFDGSLSTAWQSVVGQPFAGQWLEVDFGVESTFNRVFLSEYGNRTSAYRIQYRAGNQWVTAYSGASIGASSTVTFPAVTSRRARIYFDAGTATPIIYEFQPNNTPATPHPNLAFNRAYRASSSWPGQPAAAAFDENPSSNWQAAQDTNFASQWLEVNFGDVKTFNSVSLREFGNRTGSFRIEYFAANGWNTAYAGYQIGNFKQVSFPSITSNAVRLRFLSGTWTPIIYEFSVYFN